MATVTEPVPAEVATLADLIDRLGGIPPERIRFRPAPGTATEKDVIEAEARDLLCELVDGVLVEKPMGLLESGLAGMLIHFIQLFRRQHGDIGTTAGEAGTLKLAPGLVRMPDVSFIRWEQLPGGRFPTEPIPGLFPDLAVEILSRSNTRREMLRKLREYFKAGTRLVWLVDPISRTAEIYTAVDRCVTIGENGILDGGDVLPGFQLRLGEWLDSVNRQP